MLSPNELVKGLNTKELKKQQKRSHMDIKRLEDTKKFNLTMTIYKKVERPLREKFIEDIKK